MSVTRLPMFPLGGVLLPSTAVSLHVFEPRYRALARHCVDGGHRLGVVLIERGSEVGGGDVRFGVATRGRIAEAVELDDGRWALAVVGEDRVRVQRWLPDDPFPCAEVVACIDRPVAPDDVVARPQLDRLLRRVLALQVELGEGTADPASVLAADPAVATWQAVSLTPLGPLDAQRVLETDGVGARLDLVVSLLADEAAVLAQRLAGG
jgi:Lon protease-like protein